MRIDRTVFLNELARNCMTINDLSKKAGVSYVTVHRIKNGTQEPMPKTVGKLAKALNVTVETLIKEEG